VTYSAGQAALIAVLLSRDIENEIRATDRQPRFRIDVNESLASVTSRFP